LYWPNSNDTPFGEICHSIFKINQSDVSSAVKAFFADNCLPLIQLMRQERQRIHAYSAASKTRLVWCAESIVRATANRFFVGKIHNFLKKTTRLDGRFEVHTELRTVIPNREKTELKIDFGIEPGVFSTKFKQTAISDNNLQTMDVIRRAICSHKGEIDFPVIYVEASHSFWVTTQRFSLHKNKYDDIGYFEEPNWEEIATMNVTKFDKYLQTMYRFLLIAYKKHWLQILKQYSKSWLNRQHAESLESFPNNYDKVSRNFQGSLMITTDSSAEMRLISRQLLTSIDRTAVTKVGEYYLDCLHSKNMISIQSLCQIIFFANM
jgi:hypothetical protein